MSFLRAPRTNTPASAGLVMPAYTGLQIQTSTNTLPIPICYGLQKVAPNLIFYNNFQSHPVFSFNPGGGGKGGIFGGGGGGSWSISGYTYSADVMMALCEGPVQGIGQVFQNNSVYGSYGVATETHAIPASSPYTVTINNQTSFYLNVQVSYAATGVLLLPVAGSPAVGQYSVSAGVYTFNAADAGANVNIEYEFYQTPSLFNKTAGESGLQQVGLTFFNGSTPQSIWGYYQSAYVNTSLGVSGGGGSAGGSYYAVAYPGTAYVCAANFNLGSSASLGTLSLEVQGRFFGTGANGVDADPAQVIADFLVNPQYGVGFPSAHIDATSLFGASGGASVQTYCRALGICFSPLLNQQEAAAGILTRWCQLLNLGAVWSGAVLRFVPYGDLAVTGNGVIFTPNVAPVYTLTDADLVFRSGDDPIKVSRLDPYSLPNFQYIEMLNRAGLTTGTGQPEYQATPILTMDQAMIEQYGLRVGSSITAHEICDLGVAQTVGQILLQRQLYVRAQYKFMLSWEFCLLDPMDVVALNDANLGLVNMLVRIKEIEEDDSGMLTVTAEELTIGVSTPAAYQIAGSIGGTGYNSAQVANPVNTPMILEPPPQLTNNVAQIWVGASASVGGKIDPNWGGAVVWASLDNVTYQQIATITAPIRQGFLTAALPSATGYDTIDTLSVDLTESGGALTSTTPIAAQAGQTLCLVDGELLGFTTATLTASYKYGLTGLARGLYGSPPAAHVLGAPFARLDNAVKQFNLPANYIGQTIYLKFQSFNVFGAGFQSIANCAVYSYVPTGAGQIGPVSAALAQGQPQDWGSVTSTVSVSDQFGNLSVPVYSQADLGNTTP